MVCPKCLLEKGKLTLDHVIPKWFFTRIGHLGKDFPRYTGMKTQNICGECNKKKGGEFDFSHPEVRSYMREVTLYFTNKLNDYENDSV